jgi:hypothetical protein
MPNTQGRLRITAPKLDHIPIGIEHVVPCQAIDAERSTSHNPSVGFDVGQGGFQRDDIEHRFESGALAGFWRNAYLDGPGDPCRYGVDQDFLTFIKESNVIRMFVCRAHPKDGLVEGGQTANIDRETTSEPMSEL